MTFNPLMMKTAREYRRITQTELAKTLKKSQSTIAKYEDALLEPTEEIKLAIAEALSMPIGFFSQEIYSLAFFRAKASISTKEICRIKATTGAVMAGALRRVQERVNIVTRIHMIQDEVQGKDCKTVALELRRHYFGLADSQPIENLTRCVERLGVFVSLYDFGIDGIDGLVYPAMDGVPIIFLNSHNRQPERIRFSLAHELGHLLLHSMNEYHSNELAYEQEANNFASELLMPSNEMCRVLNNVSYQSLFSLKPYWRVSLKALIHKAKEVGAISDRMARSYYIKLSQSGFNRLEPKELSPELPKLINVAITTYQEETNYSDEDMEQVLAIGKGDMYSLFGIGKPSLEIINKQKVEIDLAAL